MIIKQSNNIIPVIHNLITMHYGENYWFNGCMKYLMECLGEKDFDYWFFSGVTGDNLVFCHTVYVVNVATNGSCRCFLKRALEFNPDMEFLNEIIEIYKKMGQIWKKELEPMGGGFKITLETLQDKEKQKAIADKIREFAVCYDDILDVLIKNIY